VDTLDVLVIVLAISAAVGGWRVGFTARVASWVGMAIGIFLAFQLLPALQGDEADPGRLLTVGLIVLFAGAIVGQMLGLLLGSRIRIAIPRGGPERVDRIGGSLSGIVGVFLVLWLVLPTMAQTPDWPAHEARNSAIADLLHDLLPEPPDTTQALRRALGPRVFEGFGPAPELGPPPAESGLSTETADRVARSTVKIVAPACSRVQEGSGSVVGPGLIATNAHVVAGSDAVSVQRYPDGTRFDAEVVTFDPDRDLALLRVDPEFQRPELPLGDGSFGENGAGAVFGHPLGGTLTLSPFRVGEHITARGYDIYDSQRTERDVFVMSADLKPGDSGGALVDASGAVQGVAFAIAPDRTNVAYALTLSELRSVLEGDLTESVGTGACIS
jgi:S1-C subfamily serine protease